MKTNLIKNLILAFAILMILALGTAMAQTVKAPALNISMMSQDPDPVSPGRYVELRFKIFNNNPGTTAKNAQVMLDAVYPFSLDLNEEPIRSLGNLDGYGNGKNSMIVKYKVRIDDKAVEGSNPIILKYKQDGMEWLSKEFDVEIRTVDANLAIVSVETVPEKIKPGEEAAVNIKVKNMADSPVKDITFTLDLTFSNFLDRLTTLSAADSITAFNAMPFAPIGSATEQKIYTMAPGEEKTFSYNIIAYSEAESKVYKVPIELTYFDTSGNEFTKSDVIGLVVGTKPDLSVLIDETDLYVGKDTGTVTIKIINKGFSDTKFLDVKAEATDDIDVLSAHEVYVGNVDSDDYETAEFKIYLKKDGKEEQTLKFPVIVEYRDANNNFYTDTYDLDLEIISPSKLGQASGGGNPFVLIVLAVVVIGGYLLYRRNKNRKKKL